MLQHNRQPRPGLTDFGLLILRVGFSSLMIYGHGWDKAWQFSHKAPSFPDPLGFGPSFSLLLATFSETACPLAILLGVRTRLAAIPLIATMATATFVVQAGGPWHDQEFALLYLLAFAAIALAGPGDISLAALAARATRPEVPAEPRPGADTD